MRYILLLSALIVLGCSTLTEDERLEKEYKENERRAMIFEEMRECRAKGGRVVITRRSSTFSTGTYLEPLSRHDTWKCE